MKLYRIQIEQTTKAGKNWDNHTADVAARTATEALRRALSLARKNGFPQEPSS